MKMFCLWIEGSSKSGFDCSPLWT